jgi:alanine-synthesizing transaminase
MKNNFHRLTQLPPYVFAEVNQQKYYKRFTGNDIIDCGMGNPMYKPPKEVIRKLKESANKANTHGYSTSKGIKGLRLAQANYYQKRFAVNLDPEKEIIVTIGSKEGLSSLATAISSKNDTIIVPDPCYPIHKWGFIIAGAKVKHIKHKNPQTYLKNLKKYIEKSSKKPLAIIVNYPGNPTADIVSLDFYEELVDFCLYHKIYIISDLAYSEIYFTEEMPPSILQIKNAKNIAIEFTSMSKTYSMSGWRIGFAAGNKELIAAITKIKSFLDYGIFTPMQVAATVAINDCDYYPEMMRNIYKERRDIFCKILHDAGWNVPMPNASMFIWTKLPNKYSQLNDQEFTKLLLEKANIAVSPGSGFGDGGKNYIRISLVENKNRIRQGAKNIRNFLLKE